MGRLRPRLHLAPTTTSRGVLWLYGSLGSLATWFSALTYKVLYIRGLQSYRPAQFSSRIRSGRLFLALDRDLCRVSAIGFSSAQVTAAFPIALYFCCRCVKKVRLIDLRSGRRGLEVDRPTSHGMDVRAVLSILLKPQKCCQGPLGPLGGAIPQQPLRGA